MSFNQLAPTVPTILNCSNCFVFSNSSSGNALSVQQLGAGNVFVTSNASGRVGLFVSATSNVGVGTTSPQYPLDIGGFASSAQTLRIGATSSNACVRIMEANDTYGFSMENIATAVAGASGARMDIVRHSASAQGTPIMSFIRDNPYVGIGTTNPDSILTISAPTAATTAVICKLVNAFTSNAAYINFTNSADSRSAFVGQDGTGLFAYATGALAMGTNTDVPIIFAPNYNSGGEKMRITGAGRVGIGTTNPATVLSVQGGAASGRTDMGGDTIEIGAGRTADGVAFIDFHTAEATYSDHTLRISRAGGANGGTELLHRGTGNLQLNAQENSAITFAVFGSERMRITSGGNVGIGTNPGAKLDVYTVGDGVTRNYATADSTIITEALNDTSYAYVQFRSNTNGTAKYTWLTLKNSAGSNQFWICANNGYTTGVYLNQNATAWSSSSDARLKNIIEPISNALSKVEQINPCIYSLKDDEMNTRRIGVIAQDVYKVLPEAVDSTPDSEQMMGVQYSSLVPLALAAIKELSAENMALKTQMASLEARLDSLEQRLAAAGL